MTAADRQRRTKATRTYRQRRRHGLAVRQVTIAEYDTIQALILADMLTIAQALDHREVERALTELVAEFSRRWLRMCDL